MGEGLKLIGDLISLVLITILAWIFYSGVVLVLLVGLCTTADIIFGHYTVGVPFPDWWWILIGLSAGIGVLEFYENIVKTP